MVLAVKQTNELVIKLVRKNKRGTSKHARWEDKRVKEGLCIKCDAPICERSGRYCTAHLEQHNAYARDFRKKNVAICNYRRKISGHRARIRVMVALGGLKCSLCPENDYRVLTIDHINGHKTPFKGRAKSRSGLTFDDIYAIERGEVKKTDLRVLCANCQSRNEHTRGNRKIYPEIRIDVREAGGFIPDE